MQKSRRSKTTGLRCLFDGCSSSSSSAAAGDRNGEVSNTRRAVVISLTLGPNLCPGCVEDVETFPLDQRWTRQSRNGLSDFFSSHHDALVVMGERKKPPSGVGTCFFFFYLAMFCAYSLFLIRSMDARQTRTNIEQEAERSRKNRGRACEIKKSKAKIVLSSCSFAAAIAAAVASSFASIGEGLFGCCWLSR